MEEAERWLWCLVILTFLSLLGLITTVAEGKLLGKSLDGSAACLLPGEGVSKPCRFYVLDVPQLVESLGFPPCSEDSFVTDPESGMVLPNPAVVAANVTVPPASVKGHEWIYPYSSLPHIHSQNAGPWYVYQALRNSPQLVDDMEEADVVYVNDYCHMMRALSEHHAQAHWWLRDNVQLGHAAGTQLLAAYQAITELPRWQRTGGRGFVFYHSHSGFSFGALRTTNVYQDFICVHFQWAVMLVIEQAQRWRCASYNPRTVAIAPYSSTELVNALPTGPKTQLLFFRGNCDPPSPDVPGKYMRSIIVAAVRQSAAKLTEMEGLVQVNACCAGRGTAPEVACGEEQFPANEFQVEPHRAMMASMAAARFCLVLPGNSQSSQRLTEAVLARCLPVLVGPPWHTLPLTSQVDYNSFAIFIELTSGGLPGNATGLPWWPHTQLEPYLKPMAPVGDRFDSRWWNLALPQSAPARLKQPSSIVPYLRSLGPEMVAEKAAALEAYRSLFAYSTQPQHPPSASDAAIDLMCTNARMGTREGHTSQRHS